MAGERSILDKGNIYRYHYFNYIYVDQSCFTQLCPSILSQPNGKEAHVLFSAHVVLEYYCLEYDRTDIR
ncbi:unnamed protein product [Spodoptera exigua]|nr:unnamed protein product [Spodoptera exigua]